MIIVLHKLNAASKPYRETLQYGYDRQQGIDRWMGQKLNGLDPWKHSKAENDAVYADMYACAFLPAHYPLPTILRSA